MHQLALSSAANAIAPPMPLAELPQGGHIRCMPVRVQEGLCSRLLPVRFFVDLIPPSLAVNVMPGSAICL